MVPKYGTMTAMAKKHDKTLRAIFARPVSGTIRWQDIEALLVHLGAQKEEREGSRVAFTINEQVHVFHRPHPSPDTDKGAVASIKKLLESLGVTP